MRRCESTGQFHPLNQGADCVQPWWSGPVSLCSCSPVSAFSFTLIELKRSVIKQSSARLPTHQSEENQGHPANDRRSPELPMDTLSDELSSAQSCDYCSNIVIDFDSKSPAPSTNHGHFARYLPIDCHTCDEGVFGYVEKRKSHYSGFDIQYVYEAIDNGCKFFAHLFID
ncbi:hypothetical protein K402DRAFT_395239 [Aulographum hederae CBS 113979]|uniref:Uncharacterized protein n=1 Tax=Aulographum hederae CBS 113979 TaxID=1176131 RepID=A0A6G1GVP3_9PEZI|nr:hypothetical protein K402DRAFT_395239 [Aulographum hederae CBS 113979]